MKNVYRQGYKNKQFIRIDKTTGNAKWSHFFYSKSFWTMDLHVIKLAVSDMITAV